MNIPKILQNLVLVILFLVIILVIIAGIPSIGDYQLLVVLSGSMEPAIEVGSVVIVRPAQEYRKGDIITFSFEEAQALTTHRIHSVENIEGKTAYTVKGDANNSPDSEKISEQNIEGKVLFSIPYAGYVVDFARKPIGFLSLVFIPAGIIVCGQIRKIINEVKKGSGSENEKIR